MWPTSNSHHLTFLASSNSSCRLVQELLRGPTTMQSFINPALLNNRIHSSNLQKYKPYISSCPSQHRDLFKCVAPSFEEAVEGQSVNDFGRVIKLDKNSRAFPSTDLHLQPEYKSFFDELAAKLIAKVESTSIQGIFVRGSLVTGNFRRNGCNSDIDLIIFTVYELSNDEKSRIYSFVRQLARNTFPKATAIDISFHVSVARRQKQTLPQFSFAGIFPFLNADSSNIESSLRSILRHYSVPIYGSLTDIGVTTGPETAFMDLAKEIREQERRFKFAFQQADTNDDSDLQIMALQWLCKRCLRAAADECSYSTLTHCRDLVPCFHSVDKQFPQYRELFLNVLQIACARSHLNEYIGFETKEQFIDFGARVVPDAVEVVEEMFLKRCFPKGFIKDIEGSHSLKKRRRVTSPFGTITLKSIYNPLLSFRNAELVQFTSKKRDGMNKWPYEFIRCDLPQIAITPKKFGTKYGEIKISEKQMKQDEFEPNSLSRLLGHFSTPVLIQNASNLCGSDLGSNIDTLNDLITKNRLVDCRISPSNVVTFCRSEHAYFEDKTLTPPSVIKCMSIREAIYRMSADCELESLYYNKTQCAREHIYIQTRVSSGYDKNFFAGAGEKFDIAQEERIWISTHGTVSSLHYDASHSALFQRMGTKRMIFFPSEAIESLGIYPLGHPLHRRARVDISRLKSSLFGEFWDEWADKAEVVHVKPGDLLLFPPFWAHYTESLSESTNELSISHTFRYW